MTIYWIRHGETTAPDGHCVGHEEVSLSETGRQAMSQLGATWTGAPPDRIVSSDLKRARASAERLAHRCGGPVQTSRRLRELDFGAWTGRSWDAIEADDGKRLQNWMENWVETAPPEGESFEALSTRLVDWLAETRRREDEDATLLVVAHAGPIRAAVCHVLDAPLDRAFQVGVDHASVSRFTTGAMGWRVECLNAERFRRPGGKRSRGGKSASP